MNTPEKRHELWTAYPTGDDRNPHSGSFDTLAELILFARMLPQAGLFGIHDNKLDIIHRGDHYKALFQTKDEPIPPTGPVPGGFVWGQTGYG